MMILTDHAKTAQNEIIKMMEQKGWRCVPEYFVPERSPGHTGRIDIVGFKGDRKIAIEVDNVSVRQKSIVKLNQMDGYEKLVILRNGRECADIGDISVVCATTRKE